MLLGRVYAAKHDLTRARAEYERSVALEPASTKAAAGVIAIDLAEKKFDAARRRIDQRLETTPHDPADLLLAGRTFAAVGDNEKAEVALKEALQLDPKSMDAYGQLARLYVSENRLADASTQFEELARLQPRPVAPLTMLGMICQLRNRPADARASYEKALAIDPHAAVAANNLAWLYAQSGEQLDVALQFAQTAKAQLPDRHEIDDTLGWVYYKKGLSTLAVAAFKQSVDRQPNNASYLGHLGLAYAQSGDKVRARQSLEQALKLSNTFDGADEARKVLHSIQG